jgi:hypothetical protein
MVVTRSRVADTIDTVVAAGILMSFRHSEDIAHQPAPQ